nr:endosialidase [uncultured Mediterranean phage uvMED]
MADRKITDLTALAAGSQATGDFLTIVDVSEAAAVDKNKKITVESLFKGIPSSVGIGTASPSANLEIFASVNPQLRVNSTSHGYLDLSNYSNGAAVMTSAAHPLRLGTANTERLRISSDGKVGIGTSSPQRALVVSDAGTEGFEFYPGSSSGNNTVNHYNRSTASFVNIITTADQHIFGRADGEKVRIDASGRLLLGSSTVQAHANMDDLQVGDGSGNRGITISSGTSNYGTLAFGDSTDASGVDRYAGAIEYYHSNNSMAFLTSSTSRMTLDSSGNVGINNSSPGSYNSDGRNLVVGSGSGGQGLSIASGTSNYGTIYFADGTSGDALYRGAVLYNHASDFMRFDTAAGERMRLDSSGRLLVGTTNTYDGEASNLVVASSGHTGITVASTGANQRTNLYFADGTSGAASYVGGFTYDHNDNSLLTRTNGTERMRIGSSGVVKLTQSGNNPRYGSFEASGDAFKLKAFSGNASHNATMQFFTGANSPTERMRLDSSGRLLVGTSSSASGSVSYYARLQVQGHYQGSADEARISFQRGESSASMSNGDKIALISFADKDGGDYARIEAYADSTPGSSDYPGRLAFSTTADGASSPTERMRIGNGGMASLFASSGWESQILFNQNGAGTARSFIIGRHSATACSSASGTIGTISFRVYTNGNVTNTNNSYGAISDIKLKENIVDASSQWNDLKAIQVRNYNFIEGQTHTQIGVVAQEVETVSPGLVSESPDRDEEGTDLGTVTKSVNYSVLYMKAVKALQEAMERIETLETKVAALEAG